MVKLKLRSRLQRGPAILARQAATAGLVAMALLVVSVRLFNPATALMDETPPAAADLDSEFGSGGKVVTDFFGAGNQGHAVAIQSDGRIIVAGQTHTVPGHDDFAVLRHNPDGTLDTGFGATGKITTDFFGANDTANAVAIQNDGRIVLAGAAGNTFSSMFGLVRYTADGGLDTSFGLNGKVTTNLGGFLSANAIAIAPDGKIVVAGGSALGAATSDFTLARYNPDGTLDKAFGTGGVVTTDFFGDADVANSVKLQPDGKIVVAGAAASPGGALASQFAVARYNSNGSLDTSFGTGGRITISFAGKGDDARALAIQSDGRIVVAGFATSADGSSSDFALARLNPNGNLDPGFGAGGKVITDFAGSADRGYAVAIQLDNKIVVAGSTATGDAMAFALARYTPDGGLDSGFGTGGVAVTAFAGSDAAAALAIQHDNKIVAAGTASDPSAGPAGQEFAAARYDAGEVVPPPPPQPDFSLSMQPAEVTAARGTTISVTATITRIAGFAGNVTVSPPATVAGIVLKPGEPVTTSDPSVTFNLKIKGKAPTGEQDLTFSGSDSGGRQRSATVKLTIH